MLTFWWRLQYSSRNHMCLTSDLEFAKTFTYPPKNACFLGKHMVVQAEYGHIKGGRRRGPIGIFLNLSLWWVSHLNCLGSQWVFQSSHGCFSMSFVLGWEWHLPGCWTWLNLGVGQFFMRFLQAHKDLTINDPSWKASKIAINHPNTYYWLVVWNMKFIFPYIGNNHPNWRTHIFQRGRYTTNQIIINHH